MIVTEAMTAITPRNAPGQPASAGSPESGDTPVLPVQSLEDTDAGWCERSEPSDDERLYRDRPPHWDSA
jgi:hypothetical protein